MIVIFNGPPGSGKDECAKFFSDSGFIHKTFKEQLFLETYEYFGVDESWFMGGYTRDLKDVYDPVLEMSRRDALIHVSENVIKKQYSSSFFGDKVAESLSSGVDYVFSDSGFLEEINPIINKFGSDNIVLIRITRDTCNYKHDSRRFLNFDILEELVITRKTNIDPREVIPDMLPVNGYWIHNNGDLDDLSSTLSIIYEKVKYADKIKIQADL